MTNYVEKIEKIYSVVATDSEFTEEIAQLERAFPAYVHAVHEYVIRMHEIQTLTGDDYKEAFTDIDKKRHNCHEAAISSLNVLNRISESFKLGKFADVDTSNRYAVADFCIEYVHQIYATEIARTRSQQ